MIFSQNKNQVKIVSDTMCKHEIVSCPSTLSAIYHLHYAIFHVTSAGIQEYKSTFQFNTRLVVIIENCGYNLYINIILKIGGNPGCIFQNHDCFMNRRVSYD